VRRAFAGRLPGERGLAARPPLFEKRLDPGSKRSRWYPTPACTTEVYEQARKSLGNVHLVENALSRLPFCSDYYRLMFKDTMHGQEHGVVTYMLKATVKEVADLELALGLPRAGPRARPLKRRMFARLLRLCDKASVQHMTLLTLGNQKILDANTKWFSGAKKDKAKEAPLVDAMDAQMLMLAMPFVLEGLAHQELTRFNAGKRPRDQVADPFRPIIGAYNDYLPSPRGCVAPGLTGRRACQCSWRVATWRISLSRTQCAARAPTPASGAKPPGTVCTIRRRPSQLREERGATSKRQ